MQYVKLTAKPDTWYKEGTEVYSDLSQPPEILRRMTLEEWEEWNSYDLKACLVVGIRISQLEFETNYWGENFERWDGEYCSCDEFEVEVVNESC